MNYNMHVIKLEQNIKVKVEKDKSMWQVVYLLCARDATFKMLTITCNRKFNIFNILLKILPYLIITLKPIFHQKKGSCKVPNVNEIDTNNMKCTWPTRAQTRGDPTRPIFHQLSLGVAMGICDSRWVDWDSRWVQESF